MRKEGTEEGSDIGVDAVNKISGFFSWFDF